MKMAALIVGSAMVAIGALFTVLNTRNLLQQRQRQLSFFGRPKALTTQELARLVGTTVDLLAGGLLIWVSLRR